MSVPVISPVMPPSRVPVGLPGSVRSSRPVSWQMRLELALSVVDGATRRTIAAGKAMMYRASIAVSLCEFDLQDETLRGDAEAAHGSRRKALGLTVPLSLQARADEVIE